MGRGLTFDTGALIAIERRRPRILRALAGARASGRLITVPAVVVAEWWRGQRAPATHILQGVRVEPTTEQLARIAGLALAQTRGSNAIDAIVMASAAQRGDVVYTSDLGDLEQLRPYFPDVRLFSASAPDEDA
jgi:predicted nucleic acid-binding protein